MSTRNGYSFGQWEAKEAEAANFEAQARQACGDQPITCSAGAQYLAQARLRRAEAATMKRQSAEARERSERQAAEARERSERQAAEARERNAAFTQNTQAMLASGQATLQAARDRAAAYQPLIWQPPGGGGGSSTGLILAIGGGATAVILLLILLLRR